MELAEASAIDYQLEKERLIGNFSAKIKNRLEKEILIILS